MTLLGIKHHLYPLKKYIGKLTLAPTIGSKCQLLLPQRLPKNKLTIMKIYEFIIILFWHDDIRFKQSYQMIDDNQNTLQDRLATLRALNFLQQKQSSLKRAVFSALAALPKEKKLYADNYYNMILCVKSFKGIMEFAIMQRQQQQIENQKRQAEERERQEAAQYEKMEKIIHLVINQRRKVHLKRFCKIVQGSIQRKGQQQRKLMLAMAQKRKQQEEEQKFYRTQLPTPSKELQSNQFGKTGPNFMQNSRRSMASQQSASTHQQFKRKFAPIKTLPPKPQMKDLQQQANKPTKKEQQEQIEKIINKENPSSPSLVLNEGVKTIKQHENIPESPIATEQKPPSIPQIMLLKDKILAILSQIKIIEVLELTQMVEEGSKAFKNQTQIAEKGHIKESTKLLERIALIN